MKKGLSVKIKIIILIVLLLCLCGIIFFYFKNRDINKYKNKFTITYSEDTKIQKDMIFDSYASYNLKNVDSSFNKYSSLFWDSNYFNSFDKSFDETKNDLNAFYKTDSDILKGIPKDKNISYSYFTKMSTFPSQFEMIDNYFGLMVGSDAANSAVVSVNYYLDKDNYSLSLFDNEGDELIYVKDMNLENYSYKEAFDKFIFNYLDNKDYKYFGEDVSDSALFPVVNVILNSEINDDIIKNFYIGGRINISGAGEFNGNAIKLDKNNIKYNFSSNSILFIRKKGCENPYLIIPFI